MNSDFKLEYQELFGSYTRHQQGNKVLVQMRTGNCSLNYYNIKLTKHRIQNVIMEKISNSSFPSRMLVIRKWKQKLSWRNNQSRIRNQKKNSAYYRRLVICRFHNQRDKLLLKCSMNLNEKNTEIIWMIFKWSRRGIIIMRAL